jgi:class 3 adenylate cyclase/pimeloyl-ACP methyl ester carboxylesterase
MEREVRYCTTEDGVRIAYCVEGEGPALVICPEFVESFSLDHLLPEAQPFRRRLGDGRQLVLYDTRGTGLSQRDVTDMSHTALLRDLEAVVRALRLKRFSLWSAGIGGLQAIAYAARHPRQVDRLVLYGAVARVLDAFSRETLESFAHLAQANWELAARTFVDTGMRRQSEEAGLRLAEWHRQSTTGDVVARMIEANVELDLTPLLPRVKAPTLVLQWLNDVLYPVALSQKVAAAIAGARFVPLQESWLRDTQSVLGAVNAFLDEEQAAEPASAAPAPPGGFRTVLFTDIVGHTEMMQRLGDEKGREVLREHERITRDVLKAHGGAEVKTMGDGFMASFGSVTKAVECAIALQRAFAERNAALSAHPERTEGAVVGTPPQGAASGAPTPPEPLHVRIGLNAGEPIEEEGPDGRSDLFGATVILAARIASQAEGGEVLASMAVRELCAGKGFLFADRGEHVLRGFEDPVRMFEVSWRPFDSSARADGSG